MTVPSKNGTSNGLDTLSSTVMMNTTNSPSSMIDNRSISNTTQTPYINDHGVEPWVMVVVCISVFALATCLIMSRRPKQIVPMKRAYQCCEAKDSKDDSLQEKNEEEESMEKEESIQAATPTP